MSRSWLPRVRSAGSLGVAVRVADLLARCERGRRCMCMYLRPLFVELPIFVLGGLVLLKPRDLVGEQAHRDPLRGAADLRGGEEHGNGKVERLLAGVRSGGTGLIG